MLDKMQYPYIILRQGGGAVSNAVQQLTSSRGVRNTSIVSLLVLALKKNIQTKIFTRTLTYSSKL